MFQQEGDAVLLHMLRTVKAAAEAAEEEERGTQCPELPADGCWRRVVQMMPAADGAPQLMTPLQCSSAVGRRPSVIVGAASALGVWQDCVDSTGAGAHAAAAGGVVRGAFAGDGPPQVLRSTLAGICDVQCSMVETPGKSAAIICEELLVSFALSPQIPLSPDYR